MNTTKGNWKVANRFSVVVSDTAQGICIASGKTDHEAEANAQLIALAGNLNQKYQLDKLEAGIAKLKKDWEVGKDDIALSNAISDFIDSITRESKPQP